MAASWHPSPHRPAGWPALVAYVTAWVMVGALLAGVAIVLLGGADDEPLPPVQATELTLAAQSAGCRLLRGGRPARSVPAVEGGRALPLRAAAYRHEQPPERLVASMRRGAIVIHYRPDLGEDAIDELADLRAAVPRATILVPERQLPSPLAATAWRRLLSCRRLDARTTDALRLFLGRYVGQGPDVRR